MEAAEYAAMDRVEADMWWYRGLHRLMEAALLRFAPADAATVLDAGCGTGGLLARIAANRPALDLLGVEFVPAAAALAAAKARRPVAVGSVNQLPVAPNCLAAMLSADVLCHRGVEPDLALGEAARALTRGGVLVLNLPAYEWMKSDHDARVHNIRRFSRGPVLAALRRAGLTPLWSSYWNSLLFPVMVAHRLLGRGGGQSDVKAYPGWLNATLGAVLSVERGLIMWGLRMPFGGSLLVVARKHD